MPALSRLRHYMSVGAGACGGALICYCLLRREDLKKAHTTEGSVSARNPNDKWDFNWDRMEPSSLVRPSRSESDDNRYNKEVEKMKPTATRHLLLIRHGQYNTGALSEKDRTLTELGRRQAIFTGERLKELDLPYTALVRSTMVRANETAQLIQRSLPDVPVFDCCLLVEGAPIPPEPPVGHWKPEYYQFHQDGPRIEAAFRRYFHRAPTSQICDSYEILVCHANVIRYFVCRALQFPPEGWLRITLGHGSITWVSILPSGRVILRSLSDTGHLPPNAVTTS